MTGALFPKYKEDALGADTDLLADDLRWMALGASAGKSITGATNATPIVITCTSHGYSNGDIVMIKKVGGNTAANGLFKIANVATHTFELTDPETGSNIAGSGAYTSGGNVFNLTANDYENDVSSYIVATTAALSGKSITNGTFDHTDPTFSSVTGSDIYWFCLKKHTGVTSTSRLIYLADSWSTAPDPIVPNSGDIALQLNPSGLFTL